MSAEAPTSPPAAPAPGTPPHVSLGPLLGRSLPYIGAAILLALTQGLGQGFVTTNIAQIAGDLGTTTTDASWLTAANMIPRATLPLMLIKIRTQFGLRRFAEVAIVAYVLVSFSAIWISDLRSALVVQALSGVASAPLSSLAFLYMLEPLAPAWRMRLGLPVVLGMVSAGPLLARVVSPALIGDGGLTWIHLCSLGMAMTALALVFLLPLKPVPHQKVLLPMDFVSFLLLTVGFGGVIVGFIAGPIHWWRAEPWIGWTLAAAGAALTLVILIELHRKAPLFDVRWLATPEMVHLTVALFLFRLILSEQSSGAPKMFQTLGLAPAQMTTLFAVICAASLFGSLACIGWMKPGRAPHFHFAALVLIAAGAWMDSHATVDTRPEQMIVSQALIGFATMLFMPPAMMAGLGAAMRKGPNYILSFIIVFLSTQSIGGVVGSGAFTTLINWREAFHYRVLTEQLQAASPITAAEIARRAAALASEVPDRAVRSAQAVASIAQDAGKEAYVMAYNDAYFLIFLIAVAAAAALLLHVLRDWLSTRLAARLAAGIERPQPGTAE